VNTDISARKAIISIIHPAVVTFAATTLVVLLVITGANGDPLELARIGSRFSEGNSEGTEGYDGQFNYYIARDPAPKSVAPLLDVPAYRYQRILLPLTARLLAFGRPEVIPWTLVAIGILSHALGTWAVAHLLEGWGISRWQSLVYGLWPGFILAIRLDLSEPLAFGLVALGLFTYQNKHERISWVFFSLAIFAKEVTVFFLLAVLVIAITRRRWSYAGGLALVSLVPYTAYQVWLWWAFGQPGIGSGGEMATGFEVVPFAGLMRIGSYSLLYLGAMMVVFLPAIVIPSLWGIWVSVKKLLAHETNWVVLSLLLNAIIIPFLPFSTFRETGGLLRFASGLVLAILLFSGYYGMEKALRLSWFWLVLNVFLLK
jgi:hypothetical protein